MTLKGLADLHYCQREYDLAEPLYRQALAIRERALGPSHPFVATSLTDLGNLVYVRGRYTEAGPMYQKALAIEEQALGPEHPRVACSLACLAYAYQGQGELAKAEAHYRRALAIREKTLPAVPADVAGILKHFTALLRSTNRSAEAEALEARDRSLRAGRNQTATFQCALFLGLGCRNFPPCVRLLHFFQQFVDDFSEHASARAITPLASRMKTDGWPRMS